MNETIQKNLYLSKLPNISVEDKPSSGVKGKMEIKIKVKIKMETNFHFYFPFSFSP